MSIAGIVPGVRLPNPARTSVKPTSE